MAAVIRSPSSRSGHHPNHRHISLSGHIVSHIVIIIAVSLIAAFPSLCLATAEIVDSDDLITRMFAVDESSSSSPSIDSFEEEGSGKILLSHQKGHNHHRNRHHHHRVDDPIDTNIPQQYPPPHELISNWKNSDSRISEDGAESTARSNLVARDNGNIVVDAVVVDDQSLSKTNTDSNDDDERNSESRSDDVDDDTIPEKKHFTTPDVVAVGSPADVVTPFDVVVAPFDVVDNRGAKNLASNRVEFYVKNFDEEQEEDVSTAAVDGSGESSLKSATAVAAAKSTDDRTRQPQVSWGIPDANAAVGAPFIFAIPANAFLGINTIRGASFVRLFSRLCC